MNSLDIINDFKRNILFRKLSVQTIGSMAVE